MVTNPNIRFSFLMDVEDLPLLGCGLWHNMLGYPFSKRYGKLHNRIMNPPQGMVVDHVKSDRKDDNRKSNLRICTYSQNGMNQRVREDCSSRYKGVNFHKKRGWRAYIAINKQTIHLGWFNDELDAAKSYNEAAKILFKEFAKLNDIEQPEDWIKNHVKNQISKLIKR